MTPIETLEKHYNKYVGKLSDTVWHSNISEPVHVDIYEVPPNQKRKFLTLITLGMCYQIQNVPEDLNYSGRTEILMYVRQVEPWMINLLHTVQ